MKLIAPDYYPLFSCTAGACRHSCCIGWEIDIDEATLAAYSGITDEFGERLKNGIQKTPDGARFSLDCQNRCVFLNENGLCDIITQLGEGALCQICADHPRFRNFFSNTTEIGLGLTCEEAARLILTRNEPIRLIVLENDNQEPLEENAEEKAIRLIRNRMLTIVNDSTVPLEKKLKDILKAAGAKEADKSLNDFVRLYASLECLDEKWKALLKAQTPLTSSPPYRDEKILSNLLGYFIYRHVSAAYDEYDLVLRSTFCVHAVQFINAVSRGRDLLDTARMYSTEIEYSDENLGVLLEAMENV